MTDHLKISVAGGLSTCGVAMVGRLDSMWSLAVGSALIGVGLGIVASMHTDCVCD